MAVSSVGLSGLSASGIASLNISQGESVAAALRRPAEALSRETESARVRLSALGRVQSAVFGVQSAARNLQDTKQVDTVTEAKNAAEAFVAAFNNQRSAQAGARVSGSGGQTIGAVAEEGRAQIAASQLQRTVIDNAAAFREAGIQIQQDGSLAVDAKALEAAYNTNPSAVTQALSNVGRAAEATASRQLSISGSVGAAFNNLSNRVQQLETRQADLQNRAGEAQRAVEATSRRYGFAATGAGAYLGIFGL